MVVLNNKLTNNPKNKSEFLFSAYLTALRIKT